MDTQRTPLATVRRDTPRTKTATSRQSRQTPGVMQPIPNIPALMEYNDSSPDNISLSHRLRDWRASGSSWTLYISTLPRTLHKWYLTIPPAQDDTYIQHPSLPPIPTVRTSLHQPRHASQPASNQSYHPSASASKQDGNQPTTPRTSPLDITFMNNTYLPGWRKAPVQPKRTRPPHTDHRVQPTPKQRKPTPPSAHVHDPKPLLVEDPSDPDSASDEDDKDEPPPLIPHPDSDSDSDSDEPPPPSTAPTTSNAPANSGPQNQPKGWCPCCDYQSSDAEYNQTPPPRFRSAGPPTQQTIATCQRAFAATATSTSTFDASPQQMQISTTTNA